jgi:NAD(P)-dependent dehydrogenase (short-subunit alcohol dehydrogenase family)
MSLAGKSILITGAARRIGRALALGLADAGGKILLHYGQSATDAAFTAAEIEAGGGTVRLLQADLADPVQVNALFSRALEHGPIYGLINNASIFGRSDWRADLDDWNLHLKINLTAPFLLSQAFARSVADSEVGCIVNLLDWRALRPGADHLPYTISKAGLAALTHSLAAALAPRIRVNGLALGAILPPTDGTVSPAILQNVPTGRWARLEEIVQAVMFLLDGPSYITGEIIHLDGGRHLI